MRSVYPLIFIILKNWVEIVLKFDSEKHSSKIWKLKSKDLEFACFHAHTVEPIGSQVMLEKGAVRATYFASTRTPG